MINTPGFTQIVEDASLVVQHLNCTFLCDILETDNTIRDTGGAQDSNPANFAGIISVCSAASFGVNTLDVDDAKGVSWYDTTLVKRKAVL